MICTHPREAGSPQSPLETYLRQINDTPLLSAEEEKELAHRIEEGDCEARDHLVRANLRLVVKIARNYQGKGVDLNDLIAEGNLGLLRAAEAFDAHDGNPLQHLRRVLGQAVHPPGPDQHVPDDPPARLHDATADGVAEGDHEAPRRPGPAADRRGSGLPG